MIQFCLDTLRESSLCSCAVFQSSILINQIFQTPIILLISIIFLYIVSRVTHPFLNFFSRTFAEAKDTFFCFLRSFHQPASAISLRCLPAILFALTVFSLAHSLLPYHILSSSSFPSRHRLTPSFSAVVRISLENQNYLCGFFSSYPYHRILALCLFLRLFLPVTVVP